MVKSITNLIQEMQNDEKFSKDVLAAPENYAKEYNLSPRAVDALKGAKYEDLVKAQGGMDDGGCYYGG